MITSVNAKEQDLGLSKRERSKIERLIQSEKNQKVRTSNMFRPELILSRTSGSVPSLNVATIQGLGRCPRYIFIDLDSSARS